MAHVGVEGADAVDNAALNTCQHHPQKQMTLPPGCEDGGEGADHCLHCRDLCRAFRASEADCHQLRHLHSLLQDQISALQTQVDQFQTQEQVLKGEIRVLNTKLKEVGSDGGVDEGVNEAAAHEPPSQHQLLDQCQTQLQQLERENFYLKEQCRAAESEKATLRSNIHKVSASWFERKTRLSECEVDLQHTPQQHAAVQVPETPMENLSIFENIEDIPKLLAEISFATGKLDLTERMCCELRKRVREYENVIDDQGVIIHGLKDQLDTYFNDNQRMSQQLSHFTKLFEDLERTEKTRVNAVNPPDNTSTAFSNLPTEDDLKKMSTSVSKTYIKLKDLILEKKSLVTEIERLKVLNVELQRRVTQQETRLVNVSDALHATWLLVSDMKEQHAQLHNSESILRYELKEKRELLQRLRGELECSREQWKKIRQMNSQSEEAWISLREELNERRRRAKNANEDGEEVSEEVMEGAVAATTVPNEFEPPVDLLLDMAIEYGVVDADDETSASIVAAIEGEDMHATRLQDLEDQCSYLYQKLMASTARSLTLASRLSALHQHYGSSDEDDDDDDEDDDEDYEDDDYDMSDLHLPMESEILTPEPVSSDTAYVSEADSGSASSGPPGNLSEEEATAGGSGLDEPFSPGDDHPDADGDLSKRLINFLPRKIEILHRENKKLEEKMKVVLEEKLQLEEQLEGERQVRRQMEQQLEHLGKCVDELQLERNGKISEAEEALKQKVASLSQREQEYQSLEDEVEALRDKFEERGVLLRAAANRVKELEEAVAAREASSQDDRTQLRRANQQGAGQQPEQQEAERREQESRIARLQEERQQQRIEQDLLTTQLQYLTQALAHSERQCASLEQSHHKSEPQTATVPLVASAGSESASSTVPESCRAVPESSPAPLTTDSLRTCPPTVPESSPAPLTTDSLRTCPPTDVQARVEAGAQTRVPVVLPADVTLLWTVTSQPQSVCLLVVYETWPGAEGAAGGTVVARAQGATIRGRLLTKRPGLYTLVLDNSCDGGGSREVVYSVRLQDVVPTPAEAAPSV